MIGPVLYPPTDRAGWRRRAAALAQLWAALADDTYRVGNHDEWQVIAEPGDLARWLDLVDAIVPAPEPNVLRYTFLRAWTSDPRADPAQDDDAVPVVYLELSSSDRELGLGIGEYAGSLVVTAPLSPAGERLARAEHPELPRPAAELDLDRASWLRYAGTTR
ncbi:MAG: hypothetical protein ACRDRK_08020 [Pseudonocardia sp.]